MAWKCAAGNTVLVPSGPSGHHLHIILNDPKVFDGYRHPSCVLVGISTIKNEFYDNTCVFEGGEHPFISNPSYVAYRYARLDISTDIEKKVAAKYFPDHISVSDEMLDRVLSGLVDSNKTPRNIKKLDF